jgi:hypothetical protein
MKTATLPLISRDSKSLKTQGETQEEEQMTSEWKGIALSIAALALSAALAVSASAVTICDVQAYDASGLSPLEGQTVTVRGVVTIEPGVFQPLYTSFYVEWEGCGINVFSFDPGIVTAVVGDTIDVTGVVTEYQSSGTGAGSTTEIEMDSWSMVGEGPGEFEPSYLPLSEVGDEGNEGRLLRTIGVVRNENPPYNFYIWQPWSGEEIQVYQANTAINMAVFSVGDTVDITGILQQYDRTAPFFDGWELSPRYQSDMKLAVPPPPPPPEFYYNATLRVPARTFRPDLNEVMPISYLAPEHSIATMEIYDLQGRRVRTLTQGEYTGHMDIPEYYKPDFYVQGTFGWDGRDELRKLVPAGVYICRLEVEGRDGATSVDTAPIAVGIKLED